jgi:hypothetical protein
VNRKIFTATNLQAEVRFTLYCLSEEGCDFGVKKVCLAVKSLASGFLKNLLPTLESFFVLTKIRHTYFSRHCRKLFAYEHFILLWLRCRNLSVEIKISYPSFLSPHSTIEALTLWGKGVG